MLRWKERRTWWKKGRCWGCGFLLGVAKMTIQVLGDSNLVVNWLNWKWKINNQKFRMMVQKTQNVLDRTDFRPMGDHLDSAHLQRMESRGRSIWNSFVIEEGAQIEAVRCHFDGGAKCRGQIRNRLGSAYVMQIAEKIEEELSNMKWKTLIEVAKILLEGSTVTQAECTAASEAALAICSLARTGSICFDLDEELIKDCTRNRKYTKLMKEYEEMRAAGNEKNEEFEKEVGWKKTWRIKENSEVEQGMRWTQWREKEQEKLKLGERWKLNRLSTSLLRPQTWKQLRSNSFVFFVDLNALSSSSYLNQEVDPSKSGRFFVVIHSQLSIDLLIVLNLHQPQIRLACFFFLLRTLGSHQYLITSIIDLWTINVWLLMFSFSEDPTWREHNRHWTKTNKAVMILSLPWIDTDNNWARWWYQG